MMHLREFNIIISHIYNKIIMISFLYCFRWLTTNKPQSNLSRQETPLFKGNLLRSSLGPGSALGGKGEKKSLWAK